VRDSVYRAACDSRERERRAARSTFCFPQTAHELAHVLSARDPRSAAPNPDEP